MNDNPNRVWYSAGRTIGLEHFSSVKFEIGESREIPEQSDQISLETRSSVTFDELKRTVDERLNLIVQEVMAQVNKGSGPKPKAAKRRVAG